MVEEIGVTSSALTAAMQELFATEFQKIGAEWKSYKQEIIAAVENVEAKLEKRLTVLEQEIGEVNKNLTQISNRIQQIEVDHELQKEQLAGIIEAFKVMQKGVTEQQGQLEGLFQQMEKIDNNSRRANVRIKKLKEDLESDDLR